MASAAAFPGEVVDVRRRREPLEDLLEGLPSAVCVASHHLDPGRAGHGDQLRLGRIGVSGKYGHPQPGQADGGGQLVAGVAWIDGVDEVGVAPDRLLEAA
jgi:hypothetical protein